MSDLSAKCSPMIFEDLRNAISSQEEASGATPCAFPGGTMTDLFGPDHAHVSPSVLPESKKASPTRATFGRNGFGSSASAGLTASLVSRLMMQTRGSILYRLTWRATATPSGRLIYRLRASAVPTSVNGSTGWPTVTTPSGGQSVPPGTTVTGRKPDGSKAQVTLKDAATFCGWGTPTANDATGSQYAYSQGDHSKIVLKLPGEAMACGWHTPMATDGTKLDATLLIVLKRMEAGREIGLAMEARLTGYTEEMASGARLNPALARWLMRLPPVFDACASTVTPLTRKSRPTS